MYRYRLFDADGNPQGEAYYAVLIQPGETIVTGDCRRLHVLNLVPVEDEDSPYVAMLEVESA